MKAVGIWLSGLFASGIPIIFVGAVVAFVACVFDAEGDHALTARSRASSQAEAATPKRILTIAGADAPDDAAKRQSGKHTHGERRHHHATPRRSRFHSRARHRPYEFGFGLQANHRAWAVTW